MTYSNRIFDDVCQHGDTHFIQMVEFIFFVVDFYKAITSSEFTYVKKNYTSIKNFLRKKYKTLFEFFL